VNLFAQAIAWIFGGDRVGTDPIPVALLTHLAYTGVSILIAVVIAVPVGWLVGHTGRGRDVVVAVSGAARALPSFGLFILLIVLLGVLHQTAAAVIAYVLLAIPSLLAGAYTGLEAIDRQVIDAGRAMGMTEWQILWQIEVPLGMPLLIAGVRAAVLQVVATVTIGAYVGLGGLGQYIITGIPLQRFDIVLAGGILVAALALVLDAAFAVLQRVVVPRGVRARRAPRPGTPRGPETPQALETPREPARPQPA
jgi:osmoprotectant transport system permease protein